MTEQDFERLRELRRGLQREMYLARKNHREATRYDRIIQHQTRAKTLEMVVRKLKQI